MSLQSFLVSIDRRFRKEAPAGADVHVSTALGEKPKKAKPNTAVDDDDDNDAQSAHLPVTNMSLAAQQLTGQAKQTAKFGKPLTLENIIQDTSPAHTTMDLAGQAKPTVTKSGVRYEVPFHAPTDKFAQVLKVDETLGLVLGWAIVCKKDGADYFDLQEDCIPEASMLSAAVDFMQNSRVAKEMHAGEAAGAVLFAFPLTEDIAKAFRIETKTTGLMIAMKPDSDEMLAKFRNGELTGFSIGGHRIDDEEVVPAA